MSSAIAIVVGIIVGLFALCALGFLIYTVWMATPWAKRRMAEEEAERQGFYDAHGFRETTSFDVEGFREAPLPLAADGRAAAGRGLVKRPGGGSFQSIRRGPWRRREVTLFDYAVVRRYMNFSDPIDVPVQAQSRSPHACAVIEVPAELPTITIERERVLSRAAAAVGLRDIQLGHPGLDAEFEIKGADEALVRELVDPALLESLRLRPKHQLKGVQLGGRFLVAYTVGYVHNSNLEPLLDSVVDLRERISDSILRRYPIDSEYAAKALGGEEPW